MTQSEIEMPTTTPPTPVVVTPIPASKSRTLRLSWLTTKWTWIVGIGSAAIEIGLHLFLNDPKFQEIVSGWFPQTMRYVAMAFLLYSAQQHKKLRLDTNAPIIGTPLASPPAPPAGGEGTKS